MTQLGDSREFVIVIDDDASIRRSLDNLLRSVGLQVQTYVSVEAFEKSDIPDAAVCLVLDIRMPGMSGLEFQRKLAGSFRPLPIVFLTGHGDIPMTVEAMKGGAIGFLTKPFRDQDLLEAIRTGIKHDRVQRFALANVSEIHRRFETLTPREREVMAHVVTGRLNKQIAADLNLSEITIKICRGQVMRKMEASSLVDLVRMADKLKSTARSQ